MPRNKLRQLINVHEPMQPDEMKVRLKLILRSYQGMVRCTAQLCSVTRAAAPGKRGGKRRCLASAAQPSVAAITAEVSWSSRKHADNRPMSADVDWWCGCHWWCGSSTFISQHRVTEGCRAPLYAGQISPLRPSVPDHAVFAAGQDVAVFIRSIDLTSRARPYTCSGERGGALLWRDAPIQSDT